MKVKAKRRNYRKKQGQKLWIVGIAAIMLLSALSFASNSGRTEGAQDDPGADVQVLRYTVKPVSETSGSISIKAVKGQLVLLSEDSGNIMTGIIEQLGELNSTAIQNTVIESTNAYTYVRFYASDIDKAEEDINSQMNLPQGYRTFRIYAGSVGAGSMSVDVIGSDLEVGDIVKVMLFQDIRNPQKIIGFVQKDDETPDEA
ncbi:hypothetical protein ACFLRF_03960 [Candidatus Altiarchaeota archaeon]